MRIRELLLLDHIIPPCHGNGLVSLVLFYLYFGSRVTLEKILLMTQMRIPFSAFRSELEVKSTS